MQKLWFRRKTYGWGWFPITWQGWLLIAIYVVVLTALAFTLDNDSSGKEVTFMFVLPAIILTIALIRICYKTGETPRWQWGKNSKE